MRVRDRERELELDTWRELCKESTRVRRIKLLMGFQGLFLCYCGCGVLCQNGNSWRLQQVSRSHMTSLSHSREPPPPPSQYLPKIMVFPFILKSDLDLMYSNIELVEVKIYVRHLIRSSILDIIDGFSDFRSIGFIFFI